MGVAGDKLTAADGLGVGSSLYLPVLVPGAKFFAGDPHYAQDGTDVLEAPLRATSGSRCCRAGTALPATEPADYWVARGRVDAYAQRAISDSLSYLESEHAMSRAVAFAYLAAAARYV